MNTAKVNRYKVGNGYFQSGYGKGFKKNAIIYWIDGFLYSYDTKNWSCDFNPLQDDLKGYVRVNEMKSGEEITFYQVNGSDHTAPRHIKSPKEKTAAKPDTMKKRTIKFRAWDWKRMTTSGIMFNTSTGELFTPEEAKMYLMEFSGKLDKNGKEIWEGDIVQNEKVLGIVVKDEGCFSIQILKLLVEKSGYDLESVPPLYDFEDNEVIGNKYENPDLLK